MLRTVRSLLRSRRRCGTCLFELDVAAKPLSTDVDLNWTYAFALSDSHEFTFEALVASTHRGCDKCTALLSAFPQFGTSFATASWSPDRNPWGGSHPFLTAGDLRQRFELCTASDNVLQKGKPSLHPIIYKGYKISGDTGDTKALGQAAKWLADCCQNHDKCKVNDADFSPTRLLFLAGENPGIVHLVENPTSPNIYAALSHRWSQETLAARLETSNLLRRRQDGILMSEFPKMMQDAIYVLRQLGIDYVWIDCMCIIQDDKDDWRQEAATMASIYANAELTLAATWCNSSGHSLFRDREGSEYRTVNIAEIDGSSVFLRQALPHFTWQDIEMSWFAEDPFIDPELEWPLLSRGWVYQEQLLSRRILHFTRHELIWECYESTNCECGWHIGDHGTSEIVRGWHKRPPTSKPWGQIIREYSKRGLTFSSDKLPALAGIAKATAQSKAYNTASYLCGLWAADLEESFFWHLSEPPSGPRLNIKMPTWSWASIAGNIETWGVSLKDIEFLGSDVEYRGNAYMGEVERAQVFLSGRVVPAVMHYGQGWLDAVNSSYIQVGKESSMLKTRQPKDAFGLQIGDQLVTFGPDYRLDIPGSAFVPSGSHVLCLLFGESTSGSADPTTGTYKEETNACCLVLRCIDQDMSHYERIGVCMGSSSTNDNRLDLETFIDLSQKQELTLL